MNMKGIINWIMTILCLCLLAGIAGFVYNATSSYKISSDFISVPLRFNPEDSSSDYQMQDAQIKVKGGFIKGIQKGSAGMDSLVIRALSPLPQITIKLNSKTEMSLIIENINPDFYTNSIDRSDIIITKVAVNTLQIRVSGDSGKIINLEPVQPVETEKTGSYKYIILGDNRDGYDTFEEIIRQINGEKPVFVIDNGDLVFSGKANQYRLFDKMVSKVGTTLCTTLGNHDIRGSGRDIYTSLYGPSYYSFDFMDSHFVFMDSSPGWIEKQAISDEQYLWLENDLKKAQGKRIFVTTHIPPWEPRSDITTNDIPDYLNQIKNNENWVEQKLNDYNESKTMDHGFQDKEEALKFEGIMSTYHVDTVYLSHIHSYMEYTKGGVRYLISGGAGAELLTKDTYYHYMIAKIGDIKTITMVELPSPSNNYIIRYYSTVQLFASAIYEENPIAVVFLGSGFILLGILIVIKIYLWKKKELDILGKWLSDILRYAIRRFKELFIEK